MGFQGGLWEPATVRVLATGKVVVLTGTNPHGQGEETTSPNSSATIWVCPPRTWT